MTTITPKETRVFRLLKRTAIVLLLLLRLDKPTGETEISRILEIDNETARTYLRSLADIGLIARANYHHGWILTCAGRQMVLGQPAENPRPLAENPRLLADSASLLPSTASLSSIGSLKAVVAEEEALAENPRVSSEERIQQNRQAFRDNGVGWNNCVKSICEMEHVTPDLINAHADRLRKEKRFSTGILITAVKENDPAPLTPAEKEYQHRQKYYLEEQ